MQVDQGEESGGGLELGDGDADAEKLRRTVIDAALQCFAADGYDATTPFNIAAKAGVTPRVVYQLFESKKAIFTAAYDKTYQDFFDHLLHAMQGEVDVPSGDVTRWVGTIIDALTSFVSSDTTVGAFIAVAPIDMARSAELREIVFNSPQEKMYSVVTGMVQALHASGRLHPEVSPNDLSYLILAVLLGCDLMLNLFGNGDAREMATALKLMVNGRLFASGD